MEILYIWVKRYKNLENFELNLSSSMRFSYDVEKNIVKRSLIRKLPRNFFPPKINNVTALIGKNGAGKSNALEAICNTLKGSGDSILSDFFVITKIPGSRKFRGYYRFLSHPKPTSQTIEFEKHSGDIKPLDVIFFSNVNDRRRNNFSAEVIDLSENTKNFSGIRTNRWDLDFIKQIAFLHSPYTSELGIDSPIAAHILVNVFNAVSGIKQNGLPSENLVKLRKFIRRRTKDMLPKTRFVLLSQYLYFVSFITAYSNTFSPSDSNENDIFDLDYDVGRILNDHQSTEEVLHEIILELKSRCVKIGLFNSQLSSVFSHPTLTDGELLGQQFNFLEQLPTLAANLHFSYANNAIRERSQQTFTIDYSPYSIELLQRYAENMSFSKFIDIDWMGLSSGQKAYLNLFSKLTSALQRTTQKDIVLLIDEGDLYLHPKWQVEFLYRLLSILSTASTGNIQVVLTSHSPLLLSDLPKQNIQILGVPDLKPDIETFGANLYDLYAGPLFLEGMTSGLFSSLKIAEFMQFIKRKDFVSSEKEYIEDFLRILGDEIYKYKFEELCKRD